MEINYNKFGHCTGSYTHLMGSSHQKIMRCPSARRFSFINSRFQLWMQCQNRLNCGESYLWSYMASKGSSTFGLLLGRPHTLTSLLDKSSNALSRVMSFAFIFCTHNSKMKKKRHQNYWRENPSVFFSINHIIIW